MKRFVIASLATATVLFSASPMPSFGDFDLDANGKLTQSEFEQAQANRMQQKAEEGKPMRNAGNAPQFADIDTNKDGVVTPLEFENHQNTHGMKSKK